MPSSKGKILEKARNLFAEHGFKGTTIAQIATASDITDAAIYRHYRSKQDVFDVIVNLFLKDYRCLLEQIRERQKSGYCLLESLILEHCAFMQDRMTDMRVIFSTSATMPSARAVIDALSKDLESTLCVCLQKGIRDGSVREDLDEEENATIIAILVLGLNRRHPVGATNPDLVRGVVAFCQRSIRS